MRPTATIAKLLTVQGSDHDFDVYANETVIIASADARHFLWQHFYEWSMFTRGDDDAAKYSFLVYCFGEYCKENQNSFNRIYEALYQQYDPTGDYSRHETIAYKNTHTTEYGKVATNETTDLESKTEYNSTIGNDLKTFDSTSVSDATSTLHSGDDTTTVNGTTELRTTGSDTTTDTRLAADNIRDVVGNNNSPQQSISDEIALRIRHNFTNIVMRGFADEYLFLLSEGDAI